MEVKLQQEEMLPGVATNDELSSPKESLNVSYERKLVLLDEEIVGNGEEGWQLVWEDEFDDVDATLSKWTFEEQLSEQNNELQFYSPNNVKMRDGLVTLVSQKEEAAGRSYTSGAVHTRETLHLLYGKVEMRAKLPKGAGLFPAFWMMTPNPNSFLPEIDILEMIGQKPDVIWMVLHALDEEGIQQTFSEKMQGEDFSKDFHTFGIEWTKESIRWFVDGAEMFEVHEQIPNEPMFLYINTAIGGNWPGSPTSETSFPAYYDIDYVKIYKRVGRK